MRKNLKARLPIALSVTALVIAVFGPAPWAGAHGVAHALFAHKAGAITTINGLGGARCASAGKRGIMVRPQMTAGHTFTTAVQSVGLKCIVRDPYEPNDSRGARVDLGTSLAIVGGTIFPAGNDDWFRVGPVDLTGKTITLYQDPGGLAYSTANVRMDIYVDGAKVATGVKKFNAPAGTHAYEVRVDSGVGYYILHLACTGAC